MTNEQIKLNEAFASACAKKSAEFIWSGEAFGEFADTSQSVYARYFGNYAAVNSRKLDCFSLQRGGERSVRSFSELDAETFKKSARIAAARKTRTESEKEGERRKAQQKFEADFKIEDGELKISKGKGWNVIIPDSVTRIGNWAFYKCSSLISITIPNSVTSIGFCSFKRCKRLRWITIPNSVKRIDVESFYGCSSLTHVTMPKDSKEFRDGAFGDEREHIKFIFT